MVYLISKIVTSNDSFGKNDERNFMGRRRDRKDKRREKQINTRAANAPRKEKERARKAASLAAK
jgi:hypothetical protein